MSFVDIGAWIAAAWEGAGATAAVGDAALAADGTIVAGTAAEGSAGVAAASSASSAAGYLSAASAAIGVVSSVAGGDASRKAMHTNADLARQRGIIAQQQANTNEDAQRRRGAMAIGRQAAGAAEGSGLAGTNLDTIQQSATDTEMDALNIRYGGQLSNLSNDDTASLDDSSATGANSAGYLNAGAAALSAGGSYLKSSRKTGPS